MTDTASRPTPRLGAAGRHSLAGALRHRTRATVAAGAPAARVIGLVGTYPPTECGIATFTANVRDAIRGARANWDVRVVRLVDRGDHSRSGATAKWICDDPRSLDRAATVLSTCDVVLIQHEYGIFGGDDGEEVVRLMRKVTSPVVVQLHTVLREPSAHQRQVLQAVIDEADLVIVPSTSALTRLRAAYSAPRAVVVPHGATANVEGPTASTSSPTILTWGLLGPGKGLEHGIAAMAQLRDMPSAPTYVIAGHTHPNLVTARRDRYRTSLKRLVRRNGVRGLVEFDNRYFDWDSLHQLVHAASVILLPYDSKDQICSGVLVEALASGKPIVATRFPHAIEVLADGTGILVDHGDVAAMAAALRRVLTRPIEAAELAARSRAKAQRYLWPNVGETFARLLENQITSRLSS
jgi:glycosyltransferase involved in cell wall biosynthesis